MKRLHKILGLVMICLSLSVVYSYADSVYGTMWKQEDTIVYPADDVEKIDFNNISGLNLLGVGGGCTGDCGFDSITTNRIDATTGVFANITAVNIRSTANMYSNSFYGYYFDTGLNNQTINIGVNGINNTTPGIRMGLANFSASSGNQTPVLISPRIFQSGTAGYNILFINISTITEGTGEKYFIRADNDHATYYLLDYNGTEYNAGGQFTAFRNLSSATETLTSADYFINCLANDNEVVITMPAVDANYSQTLMVKYTDSGSTNKCKLDGNGAEQVEGFDVYSGLTTYKDGAILKSDGSAWWITGGI